MAYKQPRIPEMKAGAQPEKILRELILFLKDFCLETWQTVTRVQREAQSLVRSVNGRSGSVTLSAADVGARADTWTPTAAQTGAMAMTRLLTSATYALGVQVVFSAAPDSCRYLFGRAAYKGANCATLNGTQDARILTLTSTDVDSGAYAITTTVNLVGAQGGTAFTVDKIVQTRVALDTGAVTVTLPAAVQLGDLYGVK